MESRRIWLTRWARFNVVGVGGAIVQWSVLPLSIRFLDLHYLAATVLAVEAAILHNFIWHRRWTWRDRETRARVALLLLKFNVSAGAVSIVGNLIFMSWLVGMCGLNPVVANFAAVILCSAANFVLSSRCVFLERRRIEPPDLGSR
jgi:putative flippase GtrA